MWIDDTELSRFTLPIPGWGEIQVDKNGHRYDVCWHFSDVAEVPLGSFYCSDIKNVVETILLQLRDELNKSLGEQKDAS